jgi:hypothetical protein
MSESGESENTSTQPKESNNPKWLEDIRNSYLECSDVVREGRREYGESEGNPPGKVALEYDLKIRNEAFQVIDELKDRLPAFILLGFEKVDFGIAIGTPSPIDYRVRKYFSVETHEWYFVSKWGEGTIDSKLDPGSSDFIGLEAVRKIEPPPRKVTIYAPQEKDLVSGQVTKETEELIRGVSSNLSDEEKSEYMQPLTGRIAELEARKKLIIAQGLGEYGKLARQHVLAILETIPKRYKARLTKPIWIGVESGKSSSERKRLVYFLPDRKELFWNDSASARNMKAFSPVSYPEWFFQALSTASKIIDESLPQKFSNQRFNWFK